MHKRPTGRGLDQPTNGQSGPIRRDVVEHGRRLSTETKSAFKTTEFISYIVVLAGILIAGAITKASSYGADHDPFRADRVWLYVTVLTVGYMISRGIAKDGLGDATPMARVAPGRRGRLQALLS